MKDNTKIASLKKQKAVNCGDLTNMKTDNGGIVSPVDSNAVICRFCTSRRIDQNAGVCLDCGAPWPGDN
ncbi:hypothetical protein AA313_de0206802 [Arthrobotrys entomopaga]|nr:hypothetical protein AA313_de0206802 [Arthrobotrys entomopaga]